ncbi:MAG: hypothetical protein F6K26_02600 [Moorea sp. SIO2I5]|nr:hypothetical protein [Moorena sp. SIO2I5]
MGRVADQFTKPAIAKVTTAHQRINQNGPRSQLNGEEEQGENGSDQEDFNWSVVSETYL